MDILCTTCSRQKRDSPTPLPAADRYLGDRLRAVLAEGERRQRPVLILSGKFGLVQPRDPLPWYDHALMDDEVEALVPEVIKSLTAAAASRVHFFALPPTAPGWRPYHECLERACWQLGIPLELRSPPGVISARESEEARQLRVEGFAQIPAALAPRELEALGTALRDTGTEAPEGGGSCPGVRNLLQRSERLAELLRLGRLQALAGDFLAGSAQAVKATLFDKTPGANWKVPFHQDLTIAVRERQETPGFGPWSSKEGIPHVQAPAAVLDSMVALRLHLDDCPAKAGALRVVPRSHRLGRLPHSAISRLRQGRSEALCEASAGDIWLIKPLLFHASSPAAQPSRRRVLHVEYSTADLPNGLQWPG